LSSNFVLFNGFFQSEKNSAILGIPQITKKVKKGDTGKTQIQPEIGNQKFLWVA
jgi:hypothetical protein